jgi:hypothetical protein
MKKLVLAFAVAALLFTAPAWAHGDEHEQHHEAAAPAAGSEMKVLEDGYAALKAAVREKDFGKIHEIVETMEPALKTVGDAHKDDAGIEGTATQMQKVLHDLHDAGDAKDSEAAATQLKKLDGGLQLLKVRLAPEPSKEAK